MKRVDLTKREQHVLMTVCRVVVVGLLLPANNDDPIFHREMRKIIRRMPGMTEADAAIPTPLELESILERLSDNEVT